MVGQWSVLIWGADHSCVYHSWSARTGADHSRWPAYRELFRLDGLHGLVSCHLLIFLEHRIKCTHCTKCIRRANLSIKILSIQIKLIRRLSNDLHCTMWLSFSKSSSRDFRSFAPIFLSFNYFRQNIWGLLFVQFHFQDISGVEMTTNIHTALD